MRKLYSKFLMSVAKRSGYNFRKKSFVNPMSNSMFREMIYIALKHLEQISIQTMDWKLTAITKLLQAWVDEREQDLDRGQGISQPNYSEFTDINNYL